MHTIFMMLECLYKLKQYEKGDQYANDLIQLIKTQEPVKESSIMIKTSFESYKAYLILGKIHDKLKQFDLAQKRYKEALDAAKISNINNVEVTIIE